MNWEAISAIATAAATFTALLLGLASYRQARHNLILQHRLEGRRVEEQYLRSAIVLIGDCRRAAIVFVTSYERYVVGKPADAQVVREVQGRFLDAWLELERQIEATLAVLASSEGPGGVATAALRHVHEASARLFDRLMDSEQVPYVSEPQLLASPEMKALDAAIASASRRLVSRLLHLQRPAG